MEISSRRRVKVYELAEDNAWQDKGTGYCVCMYIEDKQELYLHVLSEEDNTLLLNSKVMKGDVYQKQQDTLIVWTESSGQDLALSFQEAEGCTEAWDIIIDMQKRLPGLQHEPNGESFRELSDSQITLPKPELSNLSEIETIIRQFGRFVYGRDNLTSYVVHEKYIDQLLPIFETCECIENERDLYTLYNIMKGLILLNENCIFEYIVQDHIILGVVGILEYDPDYPKAKPKHREYLGNNLHFKQVIPIRDKGIENKIHQTFRLQYLKDVVLARTLDDNTFSILNSLIFFNNVDIVNYLQHDHEFLRELFGVLNNPEESKERKRDVVFFVQQFCSIAKNLAIIHRSGLYRSLSQHGLFCTFDYALPDPDVNVRIVGAEILCTILDLDPNLVRSYVLAQVKQNRKPLIETVVERFIADENLGVKVQYGEVLKVLLDTSPSFGDHSLASPVEALMAPKSDPESDELLTLFYERHMSKLFEPILQFPDYQSMGTELVLSQSNLTLCYLLCELLCFFVRLHSFRSKYFVLSSNIFTKIVTLFKSREKHLKLGALRFFRTCIGLKDEFYNRFIVKHDLFRPIVDLLLATDGKNNLTNSACLELFEFIRKENLKILVNYIVGKYYDRLKEIDYVETFRMLKQKNEQNSEVLALNSSNNHLSNDSELKSIIAPSNLGRHNSISSKDKVGAHTSDDETLTVHFTGSAETNVDRDETTPNITNENQPTHTIDSTALETNEENLEVDIKRVPGDSENIETPEDNVGSVSQNAQQIRSKNEESELNINMDLDISKKRVRPEDKSTVVTGSDKKSRLDDELQSNFTLVIPSSNGNASSVAEST